MSVLASPGNTLSRAWPRQKMAMSKLVEDLILADDDLADLAAQAIVGGAEGVHRLHVGAVHHGGGSGGGSHAVRSQGERGRPAG